MPTTTTTRPTGRLIDLSDSLGGTDVMAEQLKQMAADVRKLLSGRLTEDAVILLIKELLPRGMKLGPNQIREVLYAAAHLDQFVKPEDDK